ncbi:MAG: COX15/CtaA family protein [Hyphomicrobiales bacterium]
MACALKRDAQPLVGSAATLAVLAILQATLGVWTLLLAVPIELGVAHQAGAVVVFAAALYHFWLALHDVALTPSGQTAANAPDRDRR